MPHLHRGSGVSWDATLVDDYRHVATHWNYTHNCNRMANDAAGVKSWWRELDGMSGPEGGAFLTRVVAGLRADPDRYGAMNPDNGWGDYDRFVAVLDDMRRSVPEWPTTWRVDG
jgi:hypothetical protein